MGNETADGEKFLGQYIPIHYHAQMLRDRARMNGFRDAIRKHVPAGGKVVDLGGGTGVLSFFASEKASKVWCIEQLPELAAKARGFLEQNGAGGKVQVIQANAMTFLPPEPVDVVICEMLHSALLREKQIEVIGAFKKRYQDCYGLTLPVFIPEATLLGVQPVCHNFEYLGYRAYLPVFEDNGNPESQALGDPASYSMILYAETLPDRFSFDQPIRMTAPGTFNALRFITNNPLYLAPRIEECVNWCNMNLILPISKSIEVKAGDDCRISFEYRPGEGIDSLWNSIRCVS